MYVVVYFQDASDCFVYSENDLLKNCQLDKDYQLSEVGINTKVQDLIT